MFVRNSALFHCFLAALIAIFYMFPLQEAAAADCSVETSNDKKRFTTAAVNLRSCGSTYCDTLVNLPVGQVVYAYGEDDGWHRVNVATLNVTGYVYGKYLSEICVEGAEISRAEIPKAQVISLLISQSRSRQGGSCPCPYNTDRAGRRCGGRSAYSRPGGASPLCYPSDIATGMVQKFRDERK